MSHDSHNFLSSKTISQNVIFAFLFPPVTVDKLVESGNVAGLEELLCASLHLIDINRYNSLGRTPLQQVCRQADQILLAYYFFKSKLVTSELHYEFMIVR